MALYDKAKTIRKAVTFSSSAEKHIPAEARHTISSRNNPTLAQAPADCWNKLLLLPQNGSRKEDRKDADWLPFLNALGLQQGEYPTIQVQGKKQQTGKPGTHESVPHWNFLVYLLIAISPKGKLKSREIYNLCLALCPDLKPNNATCRHALVMMNKSSKVLLLDDQGCYQLQDTEVGQTMVDSKSTNEISATTASKATPDRDSGYGNSQNGSPFPPSA